ncbi:Retrovirus Pol polyprotein from transposon opus [Fasciola gigantica]|uniref:Retrovirus Pol polyprotein from transposon opus n=1 Tax=Fasciola gigantica TaxID=46835 RepID=A0A504Z528_FASGI|nr:Retrovirus Pol polyprotein from transposon opus [Fasciola gigantica]
MVVTSNVNHKQQMVIDYSQTTNCFTYLDAYPLPRLDKIIENISRYELHSL